MKKARFFLYIDKAYKSEIALFRGEGVTAEECDVVIAPADTDVIYRIEIEGGRELSTHDYGQVQTALNAAKCGKLRLLSLTHAYVINQRACKPTERHFSFRAVDGAAAHGDIF